MLASEFIDEVWASVQEPVLKPVTGLLDFTQRTKPDYQVNWHHRLICDYLDKFVSGDIRYLMIFTAPRHGKSELVSRRLPAYILGQNPDASIIATSYSADLASRMNRDVQRIIDSDAYRQIYPRTTLYGSNVRTVAGGAYLRNSDIFEIVNHRGVYRSAGVGGGITGMGYNYGLIDDPIKNRQEANSPTYRNSVWEWFTSTFYTRQEKDAGILITLTRHHEDDLAGRVMELAASESSDQWVILTLPAIAMEPLHPQDPREIGEALWPDKYDLAKLNHIRETIGEFEWASLYQQSPQPIGGGLFDTTKLTQIVDYEPECPRVVRFYDLAVTNKRYSDYTAGVKMGITADGCPVIYDLYHVQKIMPEVQEGIVQNAMMDGASVHIRLEAEKAGIIGLDYLLRDSRMYPYTVDMKPPLGDKYTRATPFATRVNAGKVILKRGTWNRAFIDELSAFRPGAAHDDIVDACSGAYDMLTNNGALRFVFAESDDD